MTTIEFRLRTINYAEVQLEVPDFGTPKAEPQAPTPSASSCTPPSSNTSGDDTAGAGVAKVDGAGNVEGAMVTGEGATDTRQNGSDVNLSVSPEAAVGKLCAATVEAEEPSKSGGEGVAGGDIEQSAAGGEGEIGDVSDVSVAAGVDQSGTTAPASGEAAVGAEDSKKRSREATSDAARVDEGNGECNSGGRARNERLQSKVALRAAAAAAAAAGPAGRKPPQKLVCAQPFPIMRGHTAFLTFAATPVMRQLAPPSDASIVGEGGAGVSKAGVDSQKSDGPGDVDSETRGGSGGGSGEMDVDACDACEGQAVEGKGERGGEETVAVESCVNTTDGR